MTDGHLTEEESARHVSSDAKGSRKNNLAVFTARHQTEDLTNVQFPMCNSQPKWMSDYESFALFG